MWLKFVKKLISDSKKDEPMFRKMTEKEIRAKAICEILELVYFDETISVLPKLYRNKKDFIAELHNTDNIAVINLLSANLPIDEIITLTEVLGSKFIFTSNYEKRGAKITYIVEYNDLLDFVMKYKPFNFDL